MSLAERLEAPPSPLKDAVALSALARECARSGAERRALVVRLSRLPEAFREARHQRQLREVIQPALRLARSQLFELPGGDIVVVAPPPGEALDEARLAMRQLLPDCPAEECFPEIRLPMQSAALLTLVEEALSFIASGDPATPPSGPPPPPQELDAAERALASADLAAFLRVSGVWRFAPGDVAPERMAIEIRPHLFDLTAALLPGFSLHAAPWAARRFRQAVERRMLVELARPQEARGLGAICLPISLAAATSAEFLRLEATLGPEGRRRLVVCLPPEELFFEPAGVAALGRFAKLRGWRLGLDDIEPALLPRLCLGEMAMLRLRFGPALLGAPRPHRAALDKALVAMPEMIVLAGTASAAAIGWAWQRGITRFSGRMLEACAPG
jgi:hypothetical protein